MLADPSGAAKLLDARAAIREAMMQTGRGFIEVRIVRDVTFLIPRHPGGRVNSRESPIKMALVSIWRTPLVRDAESRMLEPSTRGAGKTALFDKVLPNFLERNR